MRLSKCIKEEIEKKEEEIGKLISEKKELYEKAIEKYSDKLLEDVENVDGVENAEFRLDTWSCPGSFDIVVFIEPEKDDSDFDDLDDYIEYENRIGNKVGSIVHDEELMIYTRFEML